MLEEILVTEVMLYIIQRYLFKLYDDKICDELLSVKNVYATSGYKGNIIYPEQHDFGFTEITGYFFDVYNFIIDYDSIEYILTTRIYEHEPNGAEHSIYIYEIMLSYQKQVNYKEVYKNISALAVKNSFLTNRIIVLKDKGRAQKLLDSIELLENKKTHLDEIFIPHRKKTNC